MLILVIGWVGFSLRKVLNQKKVINMEISGLKQEIKEFEDANEELADLLEYLKTDVYLEKEAKEKLSLQKPGEKVIIVNRREGPAVEEPAQEKEVEEIIVDEEPQVNWEKWLNYFLK